MLDFLRLSRKEQKASVETLIFSTEEALPLKTIFNLLINKSSNILPENDALPEEGKSQQMTINTEILNRLNVSPEYILELIGEINRDLAATGRPYMIVDFAGGFQFTTVPEYGRLVTNLVKSKLKRRFSQASLETLAVVAYRQPVTKQEVEQIRGVNSAEIINSLIEKKLIKIAGKKDSIGKPLLYATSGEFLKVFGLKALKDLPTLHELEDIAELDSSGKDAVTFNIIDNIIDEADSIKVGAALEAASEQ